MAVCKKKQVYFLGKLGILEQKCCTWFAIHMHLYLLTMHKVFVQNSTISGEQAKDLEWYFALSRVSAFVGLYFFGIGE